MSNDPKEADDPELLSVDRSSLEFFYGVPQ